MPQSPRLDPEKLKGYAKLVFGALGGAMTSAMIYLGDRLGLYRALAGGAPLTSAELAEKTGLAERWLREWLHAQGAAGQEVDLHVHDQQGVALNRMQVISYGDAEPVQDNQTPEHRAQNRRVVIKVLE